MKKGDLLKLLEAIEDYCDMIIDVGRYSKSNWKYIEDVDIDYVNDEKVIIIR